MQDIDDCGYPGCVPDKYTCQVDAVQFWLKDADIINDWVDAVGYLHAEIDEDGKRLIQAT
ncbi:MAG: hypothetical protein LBQ12_11290 [Deltaproteobacteria bacterium]|jgi:hypothetical protein|nr:hypothetical protein [Deltaproteobacteria bacterium]